MVGVIDKGVNHGMGENVLHGVHHALAAGITDKPVMNDGDLGLLLAHCRHSLWSNAQCYWIFSSLTILPPNTVRKMILMSSATVQFSMYQIS